MRRGDFNFDKVCSDSKGGKGKANDEWVYSGSTVGLQWVKNKQKTNSK